MTSVLDMFTSLKLIVILSLGKMHEFCNSNLSSYLQILLLLSCSGILLFSIFKSFKFLSRKVDMMFENIFVAACNCGTFGVKSGFVCLAIIFCSSCLLSLHSSALNGQLNVSTNSNPFVVQNYANLFKTNLFNVLDINNFQNKYDSSEFTKYDYVADNSIFAEKNSFEQLTTNQTTNFSTNKTDKTTKSNSKQTVDPAKKNLVVFKFDEIFTSQASTTKFENLNHFVNLVINSFESMKYNTEVAIILTSGGGNALFFERAHSNLRRLAAHGYKTYAVIDTVCVSGCYMMACACDEIIAGNSSSIGSIGVFTKRYNGEKLSQLIGVEELIFKTSNKKGDIPFLGKADKESIDHIQERINRIMTKFTSIVKRGRPKADPKHFDADVWYAEEALEYHLIDKIQMVDDFLKDKGKTYNVFVVSESTTTSKSEDGKLAKSAERLLEKLSDKLDDNKISH